MPNTKEVEQAAKDRFPSTESKSMNQNAIVANQRIGFIEGYKYALEQSENKEEWVSVTEPNINWPDCEVLGYDSAVKRYGVGKLACFANGDVYLEDAFENYVGYATHYKVLKPPKNIV